MKPKFHASFDLHVLSMPPAFVLSQDQTLKLSYPLCDKVTSAIDRPNTNVFCVKKHVFTKIRFCCQIAFAIRHPRIPSSFNFSKNKYSAAPRFSFRFRQLIAAAWANL